MPDLALPVLSYEALHDISTCAAAGQALAFMLCIAVYCVAHLAWTWLKRHEHDDEMPRMCGLVQLTPQKHAKAMTYITSMKGR